MVQDSCQLVTPFMQAGTYPARGYATLELSGLELSFTGAYIRAFPNNFRNRESAPMVNLPAPDRPQLLYFAYSALQEPVFLLNSRLTNFCCGPTNVGQSISKTYAQLFCRVPRTTLTRMPWSTRPAHLCRFTVRIQYTLLHQLFPETDVISLFPDKSGNCICSSNLLA